MGGYAIKTPSFEEGGGGGGGWVCRQRPPPILGLGGSCSSIVVLTTSLRSKDRGKYGWIKLINQLIKSLIKVFKIQRQ